MIPTNLDSILALMLKNKYEAEIQKDTGQIFTIFKILDRDFPLFVRILEDSNLVQLIIFVPCPINSNNIPDLARLLHMLNKEVDLPGFCLDEQSGVLFYRVMIPTKNKKVDEDTLLLYLQTARNVCELFLPPIETIAYEQSTLDQILAKMQNESN